MADKTITTRTLTLVAGFNDGDDRTITQENPNGSINLAAAVKNLDSFCKQKQIIIGDKAGAAFTGFKTASIKQKTVTQLDLT